MSFAVKACSVSTVLHLNEWVFVYVYIYKFREFEIPLNRAFTLINQASFKFQNSAFLEMAGNSSLFDVLLYLLSAFFIFFHTLLLTKKEMTVYEAVSFCFEGGFSKKTSTPNYLELTRVHAEILPLSELCGLLPRIVNFGFWVAYNRFKVISSVVRNKDRLQCYCNITTSGTTGQLKTANSMPRVSW